jgi:peptidoglycan/xylan/chitin deacetylase (PgdA/CDA1 family)
VDEAILTTSWDDGHPLDLRLADLLMKYSIPATFYIPLENAGRQVMEASQIREIAGSFDVGAHTSHHVVLTALSEQAVRREVIDSKKRLEDITGRAVSCFCYPLGRFNVTTARTVREAGFTGARTTRALTRRVGDPYRFGTTVHAKDWWVGPYLLHSAAERDLSLTAFMVAGNLFFRGWDRVAVETLRFVSTNGGVWHLWGHSCEIEENGDWERLESVLEAASILFEQASRMDNAQLLEAGTQGPGQRKQA